MSGTLKIPVFRLGSWRHPKYGLLSITQEFLNKIVANFRSGFPGSPPYVRLGHDKDADDAKATFGDTPSLAWVKDLVQEGDVLYALADPTDPKVVEWVRTRKYRFASAEYEPNHISRETGKPVGPVLTAIGLTNEPFLTRLPEAVVLAAPPDQFYLDYEEVKEAKPVGVRMKFADLVRKLAAVFGVEVEDAPAGGPDPGSAHADPTGASAGAQHRLPANLADALTEAEALKAKLAALEEEQKRLAAQAEADRRARREAEVNQLTAQLVAEGIPPAMIEAVRPLLLADTGATVGKIKLADNTEKDATQTDLIVQSLRALPEAQRVKFGQIGAQTDSDAAAKLAARVKEDVIALGGKIREDGKFEL